MDQVHDLLFKDLNDSLVQLIHHPDEICKACPNLDLETGCNLRKRAKPSLQEKLVSTQDKKVIRKLGLKPGAIYQSSFLLDKLRNSINETERQKLCGDCPWQKICVKNYPVFLKTGFSKRKLAKNSKE